MGRLSVADLDRATVLRERQAGQRWLASDPVPVSARTPVELSAPAPRPEPSPAPARSRSAVTGLGDSIMLAASLRLRRLVAPGVSIDAVSGRQVAPGVSAARSLAARNAVGDTVVVHLGTNGTFTRGQFDALMAALSAASRVLFVTVKVPRSWESGVNATIRDGVARYRTAELVDWHATAGAHPSHLLPDGYHLTRAGLDAYAHLIARAVG